MHERPLYSLGEQLGAEWPNIRQAESETWARLKQLEPLLGDAGTGDVSLVVFGSLARLEVTEESDIDWTLLIDGLSDPAHFDSALEIDRRLVESKFKKPGQEGTFGGIASSHDIVHLIGGTNDTNRNMTQRVLLLLESAPIGPAEAYKRVMRNVLTRYISEDWGWTHGRGPAQVPRFLQNDLARYWRTVAVDFAYKRRARAGEGWAIRTVKLRLSRKMTYAAGLLACFSCDLEQIATAGSTAEEPVGTVVKHLERRFQLAPLDIAATTLAALPELYDPARKLFDAYDGFLGLLNDRDKRRHLEKLEPASAANDSVYGDARTLGHDFANALRDIFFGKVEQLTALTKIYGVF